MKTVLEVISHSTEQVNKRQFERYKLKVLEDDKVYVTEGFAQAGIEISLGDVIENMSVVKKLSCSDLCRAFCEAKAIESKKPEGQAKECYKPKVPQPINKATRIVEKEDGNKMFEEQQSLFGLLG